MSRTLVEMTAYAATLLWLGFDPVERQPVSALTDHYRGLTA